MTILIKVGISVAVGLGCLALAYFFQNRPNYNYQESRGSENPRSSICCLCLNNFVKFQRKLRLPCNDLIHIECAETLFTEERNYCPKCFKEVSRMFLLTSGLLKSY